MNEGCYIILNRSKSIEDKLYIKVGMSKNCEKRFSEIKKSYKFNGMDDELELMLFIPAKQYKKLEKTIHTLLKAYRCIGEYFMVTEEFLNKRLMLIDLSRYN